MSRPARNSLRWRSSYGAADKGPWPTYYQGGPHLGPDRQQILDEKVAVRIADVDGSFLPDSQVTAAVEIASHTLECSKDTQARYLVGDPRRMLDEVLWSRPIVPSPAMSSGVFLNQSRGDSTKPEQA